MPSEDFHKAEYIALSRVIKADKRFRVFQYLLTAVFFLLVVAGGIQVQHNIASQIDGLVDGSVARGNARAKEQKTIAKETTRYITCIFVLPLDQRTPETQQRCFDQADLPGGLTREDFSPYVAVDDASIAAQAVSEASSPRASDTVSSDSSSSSKPTATPQSTQSNNPQPAPTTPNCTIDVLFLHLGDCQ